MSFDQRIKICSWQVLDSGRVHADSKDQEGTTPLMLVGYQIFKLKINPYFTSQCNNCPGCNQRPCQNCQPSAGRGSRPQPQVSLPHSFGVSDKSCSVHSCPKNWQFVRLLENYWVVTDVTNTPPLLSVFFTWRLFDCHTIRENMKHSWDLNETSQVCLGGKTFPDEIGFISCGSNSYSDGILRLLSNVSDTWLKFD